MKHTRSSAEVEIRDAVVARFRELWPGGRIVHEMNVDEGVNRVDVASITRDQLVMCEIKSERDKPLRLADQLHAFGPCCHALVAAAHESWFQSPGSRPKAVRRRVRGSNEIHSYTIDKALASPMADLLGQFPHWNVVEWEFPEPADSYRRWAVQPYQLHCPWPERLLHLLWREELYSACIEHRINAGSRATRSDMVRWMLKALAGPAIEAAVCRQLRQRTFAEADAPIIDEIAS